MEVDHRDGDGLNNRRSNLRCATHAQNNQNKVMQPHSSRFKGVYWKQKDQRWVAYITANGKRYHLGSFRHEEDAAQARLAAAEKLHGSFMCEG
jgi:hypothetical protein